LNVLIAAGLRGGAPRGVCSSKKRREARPAIFGLKKLYVMPRGMSLAQSRDD
jgi:hypothetical protein